MHLDYYDLLPEKEWEADLETLRSAIHPGKTKAILVNNPSNPCGSCWSREHMEKILAISNETKVPLIADEVYHGLSYNEEKPFISFSQLDTETPMICTGSLSKIFCLPGWRCGWIIVHNRGGYYDKIIDNLGKLCMILLHPASIVQASLPKILAEVPESHFVSLRGKLKEASETAFNRLSSIKGVQPIKSSAAMYMMVRIELDAMEGIEDDVDFCKKLLADQNCLTFPS